MQYSIQKTFIRLFRETSFRDARRADLCGQGIDLQHKFLLRCGSQSLQRVYTFCLCHAVYRSDRLTVILRQTQRAEHADIKKIRIVEEHIGGELHIRLRRAHSREEGYPKRYDE